MFRWRLHEDVRVRCSMHRQWRQVHPGFLQRRRRWDPALHRRRSEGQPPELVEVSRERRRLPLHRLLPATGHRPVVGALSARRLRRAGGDGGAAQPQRLDLGRFPREVRLCLHRLGRRRQVRPQLGLQALEDRQRDGLDRRWLHLRRDPFEAVLRRLPHRRARRLLPRRPQLHEERHHRRSLRYPRRLHVAQLHCRYRLCPLRARRDAARGVPDLRARSGHGGRDAASPPRERELPGRPADEPAGRSAHAGVVAAAVGHAVVALRRPRSGALLRRRAFHRSLRSARALRLLSDDQPVGATLRRVPGDQLAPPLLARRGHRRRAARSPLQPVREPRLRDRSHLLRRPRQRLLPGEPGLGQPLRRHPAAGLQEQPGGGRPALAARRDGAGRRQPPDGLPERRARVVRGHRNRHGRQPVRGGVGLRSRLSRDADPRAALHRRRARRRGRDADDGDRRPAARDRVARGGGRRVRRRGAPGVPHRPSTDDGGGTGRLCLRDRSERTRRALRAPARREAVGPRGAGGEPAGRDLDRLGPTCDGR